MLTSYLHNEHLPKAIKDRGVYYGEKENTMVTKDMCFSGPLDHSLARLQTPLFEVTTSFGVFSAFCRVKNRCTRITLKMSMVGN